MKWIEFSKTPIVLLVANAGESDKRLAVIFPKRDAECPSLNSEAGVKLLGLGFKFNATKGAWYRSVSGLNVGQICKAFPGDADLKDVPKNTVIMELRAPANTVNTSSTKIESTNPTGELKNGDQRNLQGSPARRTATVGERATDIDGGNRSKPDDSAGSSSVTGAEPTKDAGDDDSVLGHEDRKRVGTNDERDLGITRGPQSQFTGFDEPAEPVKVSSTGNTEGAVPSDTHSELEHSSDDEPLTAEAAKQPIALGNYTPEIRGQQKVHVSTSTRLENNLKALRLISEIEKSGRGATPQEQETLLGFTGWGGLLSELRDDIVSGEVQELAGTKALMDARDSALTAYYTPNSAAASLWDLLKAKGYMGGRVAETSAGTGVFLNQRLNDLDAVQHFTAIEMEKVSAQVLKYTNPDAWVTNSPLERTRLPANAYDLVVGNVPFGEIRVDDEEIDTPLVIHNYFLQKSINLLRTGGVVAILTSTWTLDSKNSEFRQSIADQADLLLAMRLPGGIFSESNTQVSSDLLIFRKRNSDQPYAGLPFVNHELSCLEVGRTFNIWSDGKRKQATKGEDYITNVNEVFLPGNGGEYVGRPYAYGSRFSDSVEVRTRGGLQQFEESIKRISEKGAPWFDEINLYKQHGVPETPRLGKTELTKEQPVVGALQISEDGDVLTVSSSIYDEEMGRYQVSLVPAKIPKARIKKAIDLIRIKNIVKKILSVESTTDENDNDEANILREELNSKYDAYVRKNGHLNDNINRQLIRGDAEGAIVSGLELYDEELNTAEKSTIFFGRVIRKPQEIKKASNLREAIAVSYSRNGSIKPESLSDLLDSTFENILEENPDTLFKDPVTNEWQLREVYLSGNVREKLLVAQEAATNDPIFISNVNALSMVQPVDVPIEDIHVTLSSTWVPSSLIKEFISNTLTVNGLTDVEFTVEYTPATGRVISKADFGSTLGSVANGVLHGILGTEHRSFFQLLDAVIANKQIRISETSSSGETTYLAEASEKAQSKAEEINSMFSTWLIANPANAELIHRVYNESFNSLHFEDFKACNYPFVGLSPLWKPREHQEAVVLQGLMTGNLLVAHCVGAGKTLEMVMLQMERKRLGIYNKPAIAVPNHMLYQMTTEALTFYPSAKIVMISKDDLSSKTKRRALFSKVALNDWDLVVLTHDSLKKLQVSAEYQLNFEMSELETLDDALDSISGLSARQKQLKIKRKRDRISKLKSKLDATADPFTWEMLGIDGLAVDEAHAFKNLELDSIASIPGVNDSASDRAWDLYIKSRQLFDRHGGEKGLDLYTGTPLLNSITELYTMHRLGKPSIYKNMGIHTFSDWVGVFGKVTTTLEMLPEGGGYQMKSRLADFANIPELLIAFRLFANIKTPEDLSLPVPDHTEKTIVAKPSQWQLLFGKHLVRRAKLVRNRRVEPNEDNLLKIVSDGRKAAMDMRLVNEHLPKENDTKLDEAIKHMFYEYQKNAERKGVQIVFCDVSTPNGKSIHNPYSEGKKMLVALGVPEHEIAFVQDYKKDADKAALFKKVRAGEIRFLWGSTETLGSGTNVQDLLCASHDLDAPWRPGDLVQRKGRSVRQGNTFSHITLYRYTTEDSFDLYMWETNKRKAKTINQIMRDPRSASRTLSEDSEIDFAQVVAITTGDPAVKEKVEVDSALAKLERQEKSFYAVQSRREINLRQANVNLVKSRKKFSQLESIARVTRDFIMSAGIGNNDFALTVYKGCPKLQGGPTTWLTQKQAAKSFSVGAKQEQLTKRLEKRGEQPIASFLGMDIYMSNQEDSYFYVGDIPSKFCLLESPYRTLNHMVDWVHYDLPSMLRFARRDVEANADYIESQKDQPVLTAFTKEAEINELRLKQRELDIHLRAIAETNMAEDEEGDPYIESLEAYFVESGLLYDDEDIEDAEYSEIRVNRQQIESSQSLH